MHPASSIYVFDCNLNYREPGIQQHCSKSRLCKEDVVGQNQRGVFGRIPNGNSCGEIQGVCPIDQAING